MGRDHQGQNAGPRPARKAVRRPALDLVGRLALDAFREVVVGGLLMRASSRRTRAGSWHSCSVIGLLFRFGPRRRRLESSAFRRFRPTLWASRRSSPLSACSGTGGKRWGTGRGYASHRDPRGPAVLARDGSGRPARALALRIECAVHSLQTITLASNYATERMCASADRVNCSGHGLRAQRFPPAERSGSRCCASAFVDRQGL